MHMHMHTHAHTHTLAHPHPPPILPPHPLGTVVTSLSATLVATPGQKSFRVPLVIFLKVKKFLPKLTLKVRAVLASLSRRVGVPVALWKGERGCCGVVTRPCLRLTPSGPGGPEAGDAGGRAL